MHHYIDLKINIKVFSDLSMVKQSDEEIFEFILEKLER